MRVQARGSDSPLSSALRGASIRFFGVPAIAQVGDPSFFSDNSIIFSRTCKASVLPFPN